MGIIFLADNEPYGVLMAMAFIDSTFPDSGTINPRLDENVILTMCNLLCNLL